jgi:uncharacterized protein RhaS with RHS repeats
VYDACPIRSLTQEDPIGLAGGLNLYGFANGDPVTFSDPFGLCPNPPCFRVVGGKAFVDNWNGMVAASPYLRGLVAEASRASSPEFNLVEVTTSIWRPTGGKAGGGLTQFRDGSGQVFDPGGEPGTAIGQITSYVSSTDANDSELQGIAGAKGGVLTLSNLQAHEFGHGILRLQGYKPKSDKVAEAQANKVECKVMSETGGACTP